MNITTNESEPVTALYASILFQQFQSKLSYSSTESARQQILRSSNQQRKPLSYLQIIEICSLYLILAEHTIIFILTFRKKGPKIRLFDPK
jgi:hypothetical protein